MQQKRILIADDEPVMQDLMASALMTFGYKIDTVTNGREAIDRINQISYDLIITDYEMPKMNGLELIRWVKSNHPGVPVVIVTGTAPVQENLKRETIACISKPFTLSKFRKTIEQALERSPEL